MGQIRIWGFKVVPGEYVGGGLFAKVALLAEEDIEDAMLSAHARHWWYGTFGYLTRTDLRLIYTPYRWPISLFNSRPVVIGYSRILDCERRRRWNLSHPLASLQQALVVRTDDDRLHMFWPATLTPDALVHDIRQRQKLRSGSDHP
jgi:hypothetical protein